MDSNVVDVVMLAYNQSEYISQAIESVMSQTADCRLIIGEDCSKDNTLEICYNYQKKYPNRIFIITSDTNVGLVSNYQRCFNYCTADYVAILEADDYWIDKDKLAKQLEIFSNNESMGLVHCKSYFLKDNSNELHQATFGKKINLSGNVFDALIQRGFIYSLTTLFKRSFIKDVDFEYMKNHNFKTIDYFLWLTISRQAEVGYLDEYVSVYRILTSSISNNNDFNKLKPYIETKKYTIDYFFKKGFISEKVYADKCKEFSSELLVKALKSVDFKYFLSNLNTISIPFLIKRFLQKKNWI